MADIQHFTAEMALLATTASIMEVSLADIEDRIIVNMDSRQVSVKGKFGNDHDHLAKKIVLEITRYVGDVDLADHTCAIHWGNGKNGGIMPVTKRDLSEDGKILVLWELTGEFTEYSGYIVFAVHFFSVVDGNFTFHSSSDAGHGKLGATFNASDHGQNNITPSEIEKYIAIMNEFSLAIDEQVKQVTEMKEAMDAAEEDVIGAIEQKGAEVLASIPEDYTALSEKVSQHSIEIDSVITDLRESQNILKTENLESTFGWELGSYTDLGAQKSSNGLRNKYAQLFNKITNVVLKNKNFSLKVIRYDLGGNYIGCVHNKTASYKITEDSLYKISVEYVGAEEVTVTVDMLPDIISIEKIIENNFARDITAINEDLGELNNEIFRHEFNQLTDLVWEEGYVVNANGTITGAGASYCHTDISVNQGYVFEITGYIYYDKAIYGFLDAEGNVIERYPSSYEDKEEKTTVIVTAPYNAKTLRINRIEPLNQSWKTPIVKKRISVSLVEKNLNDISENSSNINKLDNEKADMDLLFTRTNAFVNMDKLKRGKRLITWNLSSTVNMNDESSYLYASENGVYTDIYPIKQGTILAGAKQYKDRTTITAMFFDDNGNYNNLIESAIITAPCDGYVIFEWSNIGMVTEGVVVLKSIDDYPYPNPYYHKNYVSNPYFDTELPLDTIDKSGGYMSLFPTFATIGDSLFSGCMEYVDESSGSYKYSDNLKFSCGAFIERITGCKNYHFGRGGQYLHDRQWYDEWKDKVIENPCYAYIINIGFNDSKWMAEDNSRVGSLSDINTDFMQNPNTFYGEYARMIQFIKSVQPKAKIFLCNMEWNITDNTPQNNCIADISNYFDNCYLLDLKQYAHEPYYEVPNIYKTGLYHKNSIGYLKTAWDIMTYIDYIIRHNMEDFIGVQLIGTSGRIPTQSEIDKESGSNN